jgi:hypothetical protein
MFLEIQNSLQEPCFGLILRVVISSDQSLVKSSPKTPLYSRVYPAYPAPEATPPFDDSSKYSQTANRLSDLANPQCGSCHLAYLKGDQNSGQ